MAGRLTRYMSLGLNLFLAADAVAGALWVVPGLPREWVAGTPFSNYTIPALALGVVVGFGALVSAFLVMAQPSARDHRFSGSQWGHDDFRAGRGKRRGRRHLASTCSA